jgi:tetratricopeptide (TPR) repeat protein
MRRVRIGKTGGDASAAKGSRQARAVLWVEEMLGVRGMRRGWRGVRSGRLILALVLVPWLGGQATADPTGPLGPPPAASAPQPSAAADAATYARCMNLAKDDPKKARSLAQSWLARGGAHPADHCAAVALITLGEFKEGATRLEALAKTMTTAPASLRAGVLDQAGQAWLLAGDPLRAYAAAGEAVALQPGDPNLLIDRAEAAASAGYLNRAVADLDQVLKTNPDEIDALIYRATAYRALDRLDPARADIDKALAEAPRSAAALLEAGNIRRLEGDAAGARRLWQEVGRVAPGTPEDMAARVNLEHLRQARAIPAATPAGKPARR